MTQPRSDLLSTLTELSETFPEFRFGQMIAGLAWAGRDFSNEAIFEIEDEALLIAARDLLARRASAEHPREASCASPSAPTPT
jgi:hypothetical protein